MTLPPKLLITQPSYSVIREYHPEDNKAILCFQDQSSKCNQRQHETEDFGGHFAVTSSGTVANGTVAPYTEFVPKEGPIPSLLIQLHYQAFLMEIKPELRDKK